MNDLRGDTPDTRAGSGTAKIIAGVVVVAMVAAIGAYTYESGMWNSPQQPNQVVASKDLPAPTPPIDMSPSAAPTQNEPAQPAQNPPAPQTTPSPSQDPASPQSTPPQ